MNVKRGTYTHLAFKIDPSFMPFGNNIMDQCESLPRAFAYSFGGKEGELCLAPKVVVGAAKQLGGSPLLRGVARRAGVCLPRQQNNISKQS